MHSILILLRCYSYIIGFISRTETEEILRRKNQVGACVLRFSDSIPGAISFSYLYSEGGVSQVCNVAPFTKDDLLKQIMAERLKTELYGHEQTYICYEVDGQPDGIELIPATNIFETSSNLFPIIVMDHSYYEKEYFLCFHLVF